MSRARDLANGTFSGAFSADSPTLVVDDANNRVGVGTASPSALLDVDKSQDAETNIELTNTNAGSSAQVRTKYTTDGGLFTVGKTSDAHPYGGDAYIYNVDNTNIRFATNDIERMRINNAGSVSIGTASSPNNAPLLVHCATDDNIRIKQETHAAIQAVNDAASAFVELKLDGSSLLLNSQSSGKVLVGTTSTFDNVSFLGIQSLGGLATKIAGTAATSQVSFFNDNGRVGYIGTSGTTTTYFTSSDYRLKENVVPLTGATERLKKIPVHQFNFIADPNTTVDGFLAHEVADVVPEAVGGTKDAMRTEEYEVTPAVYEDVIIPAVLDDEGNEVEAERTETQLVTEAVMGTREVIDPQGIDQSKLVPLLTAAIKEQQALIEDLQTRLAALEAV